MSFVSSLAELVLEASAITAVILIDCALASAIIRPGKPAEAMLARCAALIILFLIAFSVRMVAG